MSETSEVVDPKLVKWLVKHLSCVTEAGRVCRFRLMHAVSGEGADQLLAIEHGEGESIEDLAQELWSNATHDASTRGVGMPQRYVVLAYESGNSNDHMASFPFVIRGRASGPLNFVDDSEPPNERGMTAQLMRTVENQNRLIVYSQSQLVADLDRERAARYKAEDREIEVRKLHQELLDRNAEREVEKAAALMRAKRLDQAIGSGISLLPLLASKFLGDKAGALGIGAASSARDLAMKAFLKNLTRAEVEGIFGALQGQNKLALLELYNSFGEEDAKEQEELPEALRDAPPSDEKAGPH